MLLLFVTTVTLCTTWLTAETGLEVVGWDGQSVFTVQIVNNFFWSSHTLILIMNVMAIFGLQRFLWAPPVEEMHDSATGIFRWNKTRWISGLYLIYLGFIHTGWIKCYNKPALIIKSEMTKCLLICLNVLHVIMIDCSWQQSLYTLLMCTYTEYGFQSKRDSFPIMFCAWPADGI